MAQQRVITAALELFAENGIGGTSLRMIAAELGVTVAAVYHQFHTKDEIIFVAVDRELLRLKRVVEDAEGEPKAKRARAVLIDGMIELTMGSGRRVSAILNDPAITRSMNSHAGYQDLIRRIRRLLMGDDDTRAARVRTATLIAALNGTATHPMLTRVDDQTLRNELRELAHRLLPRPGRLA